MQPRYLGDAVDHGKFALLRRLCGVHDQSPPLRLGINFYICDPEQVDRADGRDGEIRFVPPELVQADPELCRLLAPLKDPRAREIRTLIRASVLPPGTLTHEEPVAAEEMEGRDPRVRSRMAWHGRALNALREVDLIFLDPDNGLEVDSVETHHRKGPKYVSMHELQGYVINRQSIVLIQFPGRVVAHERARDVLAHIRIGTGYEGSARILRYTGGTNVLFLILPVRRHEKLIGSRLKALQATAAGKLFREISEEEEL